MSKKYGTEAGLKEILNGINYLDNPKTMEQCPECKDNCGFKALVDEDALIVICRQCGHHLYFDLNAGED